MSPYFNSETGELSDPTYADGADHIQPAPATPRDAGRPAAPALPPGYPALDTAAQLDAFRAAILADPYHAIHKDPALLDHYALAQSRLMGQPDGERVIGEVFEGGRMRPPGADALSPAPRPVLPEGHAWDEGALVLAETEAHACGLAPHVVMQATDELARAIEAGVQWSAETGEAELIRRHGREGAERMADRARIAYQTIVESEHPRLVQRVQELAGALGDDPNVVALFAGLYDEIRSAPPTAKLMALLERRESRLAQGDAAAHARRAQAQQAETIAAEADALGQLGAQHRRWQPRP